jgi:hypothetical protein
MCKRIWAEVINREKTVKLNKGFQKIAKGCTCLFTHKRCKPLDATDEVPHERYIMSTAPKFKSEIS